MNKRTVYLLLIVLSLGSCRQGKVANPDGVKLSFAFLTDIHLNRANSNDRYNGFLRTLEKVRETDAEFIVLGGDLLDISNIGVPPTQSQTDSMYTVMKRTLDGAGLDYYPTIGNHDRFFGDGNDKLEGDEVFKTYFGASYYTFERKGVRFFILNSVQIVDEKDYWVGKEELDWLKSELSEVSDSAPIVAVLHVPVYSLYYPVVSGKFSDWDVVSNFVEVRDAFKGHNLKLVLQGHQHLYEEIFSQGVQYITGGAVCANWWTGAHHGTEPGFLLVHINNSNRFTWEYVHSGWTPKK
jgi:3',5'-cyclic AMP phosphodiesterase CpdA